MSRDSIRIAILNDYEVVVAGLAEMLAPFGHRVEIVELDVDTPPQHDIDIALYDTFAQAQGDRLDHEATLRASNAACLVLYGWATDPRLARQAIDDGASGYVSKRLAADELVAALERVHAGEQVVELGSEDLAPEPTGARDWPGRPEGLSERESEIIALIVQGLSNDQVAARAFVSINTIKFHLRSAYRKMGVESRSQAVLWGIDHGFRLRARRDSNSQPSDP